MSSTRLSLLGVALGLVVTLVPVHSASAQWAVFDGANYSQNILTAANTLQSTVNEVQQINNQISQITNQVQQINQMVQNLQRIPANVTGGLLNGYVNAWKQMTSTFTTINGLAANMGNLTKSYNALYPTRSGLPLSGPQVLAQQQQYLSEARKTFSGVYQQSGAVMAGIPSAQTALSTTLSASTGAQGNLDAMQSQTQLTAQVAQLLVQQNAQTAAMNQAQADALNQQMEMLDTAQTLLTQSEVRIPQTQPPAVYLPAFH
jgi:P-type conjugative transfer protein TrbJ